MGGLWLPGRPHVWVPPAPRWEREPYDWPGLRREPLRATWGFVQAKSGNQGAGSSLALATTSNVTVGNRLIVLVYTYGSGITLSQVADSQGNGGTVSGKFDQALVKADPFNGHLYCMTAPITSGGADTVTATASGSASFLSMWIGEYSGLSTATGAAAGGSVVDVTASNNGTLAAAGMSSGTTGATTAAGQLAIAGFGDTNTGGTNLATSPGGSWTERMNNTSGSGGNIPMVVNDETPGSGATVSISLTCAADDGGNGFAVGVVVFKLAGAAAGATAPSLLYARQAVGRASLW